MSWVTSTVASSSKSEGYYDNSGFTVDMGGGLLKDIPLFVWVAVAAAVVIYAKKLKR